MEIEEVINARNEYFNKIKEKNSINNSRIDQIDLDNIGICLNYQQIDLINYCLKDDKIGYKKYQSKLFDFTYDEKIKRDRYLSLINDLVNDLELPEKVRNTLKRIYDETLYNNKISKEIIILTLIKLVSKLPIDLQKLIYNKINNSNKMAYEGIKEMSFDASLKLLNYIDNDYTEIIIKDAARFNIYSNPNGTYNKKILERCLNFCYDNDKQVRLTSLINYNDFSLYLKNQPKEIVKQSLINYIASLTKYINNYNLKNKRVDRKPIIRSIDVFENLLSNKKPYLWRGKLNTCNGWQSVLSLEDLCDVLTVARKNLPHISFCYSEDLLENKEKRKEFKELVKAINSYEKKNKIKLIDVIGIKMHVSLDVLKEDLIDMFKDLSELNIPISITEFDLCAPVDMIINNKKEEIEILRDRFISDLCNIITNLKITKEIKVDSISVDSVNDKQNHMLTIINEERLKMGQTLLKTIYGGLYDNDMNRKEVNTRGIKRNKNNKGMAETMSVGILVISLILILIVVCYIFTRFS